MQGCQRKPNKTTQRTATSYDPGLSSLKTSPPSSLSSLPLSHSNSHVHLLRPVLNWPLRHPRRCFVLSCWPRHLGRPDSGLCSQCRFARPSCCHLSPLPVTFPDRVISLCQLNSPGLQQAFGAQRQSYAIGTAMGSPTRSSAGSKRSSRSDSLAGAAPRSSPVGKLSPTGVAGELQCKPATHALIIKERASQIVVIYFLMYQKSPSCGTHVPC
jgi:hypothetical protein